MKITKEFIIDRAPSELVAKCMAINPTLTLKAADGCAVLANSTGWFAVPADEAVEMFISACAEFSSR